MASTTFFTRSSLVLLFTLVVAGAGCKPGAQDLCERYAKAQCRFQYGCCNATERGSMQNIGHAHHNEQVCVEEATKALCALFAIYADAEQQGRVTWDYEKANACLTEVETAANSCDAETMMGGGTLSEDCNIQNFLTGAVEDEDTCYHSFECANEEAVCVENEPEDEDEELITEKGKCTPPPGIGDECPDYICTEAGWCDTSEDPPVCKAKKPNGEGCSGSLECESGVCDFSGGAGECGPKKPEGAPCFADNECASEFCDDVAGECAAKQPNGEPCTENAACQSDYCDFATGQCASFEDDDNRRYDICSAEEQ